ncbi:putative RNA-directed DNA polymerase, eukaryota, reverse transcriptase zinc-binding domain protein [Tanacetum coccineum]
MIKTVTNQEVKDAIFSMGNDKSPGPDGYTTAFFKEAWDVVANDVTKAVQEFFTNGKLLKELNHTVIALIHKVPSPSRINDYRPISCCNVLFKCISEIISNHIKESLTYLVSPNQYAVVPGRRISDNILLTQELMHNYHLDRGPPRCAFKVDIQKAYDTVDWGFLKQILMGFGFHDRMIHWIVECVSSTSFSLSINGVLHGYFKGQRGLHQGDPISPYLFSYYGGSYPYALLSGFCFILSSRVLLDIEQLMHGFLWCQGDMCMGKAKVSWEVVCLPKKECGLGLWRLDIFNKALMVSHMWSLLLLKESL